METKLALRGTMSYISKVELKYQLQMSVKGNYVQKKGITKILADQNRTAIWKGKKFWIGLADAFDGEIKQVYSYTAAKNAGFHHSLYMDQNLAEDLKEGKLVVFWIDGKNVVVDIWVHNNSKSNEQLIKKSIIKQIKFLE